MPSKRPEFFETLLLKGGNVFDLSSQDVKKSDIMISGRKISEIGNVDSSSFSGKTIDCTGKVIVPGLIDLHVHLREPGEEHKETIETGSRAGMNGGFTAICCMPNTKPCIDNRGQVEFIKRTASGMLVDVYPIAAITKNREGQELTEMSELGSVGAVGFSDDGSPVRNAAVMRNAMEYAAMLGYPIIDHCEDKDLSADGVMNESIQSTYAGLRTIPSLAESVHVARDVLIAEYTGCPVHIAHVSAEESVRIIRNAKARKVPVTAETCPHYLVLTDEAVRSYDTHLKMNPPLRTEKDRKALIDGLKDGTIDVIATDHAPHHPDDKDLEFNAASFGIIGLETAVGIILHTLYHKHKFSLAQIIALMSTNPRRIVNLPELSLSAGSDANITILDPDREWVVNADEFYSKSVNTPFNGWKLKGRAVGVVNNQQFFIE